MDSEGAPSQFVDVDRYRELSDLCENELNASSSAAETFWKNAIKLPFLIIRISTKKWFFGKEMWHY